MPGLTKIILNNLYSRLRKRFINRMIIENEGTKDKGRIIGFCQVLIADFFSTLEVYND